MQYLVVSREEWNKGRVGLLSCSGSGVGCSANFCRYRQLTLALESRP